MHKKMINWKRFVIVQSEHLSLHFERAIKGFVLSMNPELRFFILGGLGERLFYSTACGDVVQVPVGVEQMLYVNGGARLGSQGFKPTQNLRRFITGIH